MKILEQQRTYIEAEIDMNTIIYALKNIEIVGQPEARPYRDATIELREISLSDIRPVALYIVTRALARQFALRADLQSFGHDTLHLDSALRISHDGNQVGLIPPIVEETEDGSCLMDGLHRSIMARSIGESTIRVLHITNIDPAYPLTSYPNEWDEVRMYDATPIDRSLKKHYRSDADGHFFRDLSTINNSQHRGAGDAA